MTTAQTVDVASHAQVSWHAIDWQKAHRNVRRLQIRIVKAAQVKDWRLVASLQRLLTHSFSAKALAVKRVVGNKGHKTPGIDGQVWDTPNTKTEAIRQLQHKGYKPLPLRRIHIPKGKGRGYRKLGIPTMKDRAMQALFLLALEPVAETTASPNSYGFRPERSCADAIAQCFSSLAKEHNSQWILEADIQGCFDTINHEWLKANIPMDTRVLSKWLKAGSMEKGTLFETKEGTPQGSPISPCLANLTLDGLETELRKRFPIHHKKKVNLVRYADDFIITGISKEVLEEAVKPLVENFLCERGLQLSEEKTKITHIEEGFDFLGQNIRRYRNGKLLIKPSKKSQKELLQKVRWHLKDLQGSTQELLITRLNRVIRGWANYHRHVVSAKVFTRLDHVIWQMVYRWVLRRHSNKSKKWVKRRYFRTIRGRQWMFACDVIDENGKTFTSHLRKLADTPIKRHIKIKGNANPYDPQWELYFERRIERKMKDRLRDRKKHLSLYKRQEGKCPHCNQRLNEDEGGWNIHHITPRVEGGIETLDNLVLLHPNCHRQIHAKVPESVGGLLETTAFDEA
ncbi:MAG: group II intron reverse transcriptase/maturase [Deltaproteobacteria bacterium]|nr:MAG: group II intron reverse transcriptase/maturase [Deltaproteobacteria bacterium]